MPGQPAKSEPALSANALLPTALTVLGLNVVLMLVKLGVGRLDLDQGKQVFFVDDDAIAAARRDVQVTVLNA